jgi:hypothetical protein
MITDRMRINHADTDAIPDYGSLFLRIFDEKTHVNDYCGSGDNDVDKLDLITNAAVGSTCLFISGDIYIKTFDGWVKFGEVTESTASAAGTSSLHLSPLGIDRNTLYGDDAADLDYEPDLPEETAADKGEESTLEAQRSDATSSTTADEVSV